MVCDEGHRKRCQVYNYVYGIAVYLDTNVVVKLDHISLHERSKQLISSKFQFFWQLLCRWFLPLIQSRKRKFLSCHQRIVSMSRAYLVCHEHVPIISLGATSSNHRNCKQTKIDPDILPTIDIQSFLFSSFSMVFSH